MIIKSARNYKYFFKNKKILMMGLGVLGRGINVAKFLAECGAELAITDLKTEEQLASSLKKLKKFRNIRYVLGKHDLSDFSGKDMVIKAAGVPLDSPYIAEARKNKIPVEMDASLFVKIIKLGHPMSTGTLDVQVVGVTGTRGKSTVTHLIYEILKAANGNSKRKVYLGGNVKGLATLPLLKKVKESDVVVMELDSWQLQGFGEARISPNIAVFTTFLRDHQNYYGNDMNQYFSDKANIFKFQKENDFFIVGEKFSRNIKFFAKNAIAEIAQDFKNRNFKRKTIVVKKSVIPKKWKIKLIGEHNLENIALAVEAARKIGVKETAIKKAVEKFKGLPGRLEFIKEAKGVKYYNDTTATTPDGVIAGLEAFKRYKGKIILIGGGADKNLEYEEYAKSVKKYVKVLVLFKGAASDKIMEEMRKGADGLKIKCYLGMTGMKEAVKFAQENASKGYIVLLSPGAASFGVFKNEFDRGDQFIKEIKKLK